MNSEFALGRKFLSSTYSLSPNDAQHVLKAVDRYLKNPESPSLHLEPISGRVGAQRLWSIRASQEIRILLARQGPLTVFLRAGRHDDIYRLAGRTAFVAPLAGTPALIGVSPGVEELEHPLQGDAILRESPIDVDVQTGWISDQTEPWEHTEPSILAHWSDKEIAELGFTSEKVAILRQCQADNLLDVWADITEEELDLVLKCCEISPEEWREQELLTDENLANERFRAAVVERGAIAGLSEVLEPDEIKRLLKAPVEEWMVFLHPEQSSLVHRRFNGPARVRGSAGTGKTVVALHRAAALAKRFTERLIPEEAPILFTTYISNLPPVFKNLYLRLPTAVQDAVEFVNIHKLAYRICEEAGRKPEMDPRVHASVFAKAYRSVVVDETPLYRAFVTKDYLKDEVAIVIKGMGIDTLDEYLKIKRTGRRTPFGEAMRRQAWELREEYDQRLASEGIVDFADVLRDACDIAQERQEASYSAAIVDEAQDLTLVGLRLVHALVTGADAQDSPDCLFVVGDGAQKIYPGGFTLTQAGVDVRGNSSVLAVNYRNTEQIITTAQACAGEESVEDLEEEYVRGDESAQASREGVKPQLVKAGGIGDQVSYVIKRIESLCEDDSLSKGDFGIFAATNQVVKEVKTQLQDAGFRCQNLESFKGKPNTKVKVGTFHRAKGLEFKVVFILGLTKGRFPSARRRGQSETEHEENTALQVSQLFVAMTRARDALFLLYDGEPSEVLYSALEHCELVDADEQVSPSD